MQKCIIPLKVDMFAGQKDQIPKKTGKVAQVVQPQNALIITVS